jgi:predicted house-cleaning NTP pyrophosphatase (Maf/HAM1 superfamily)
MLRYFIQKAHQRRTLVRAIEGDYLNVVGLPVAALFDLMESSTFRP